MILCYVIGPASLRNNYKLLTAQLQQLRAVEMQQSTQGRAVCAVLKQVVHRADPGDLLGRRLLLPVASLHYIKYKPLSQSALFNFTYPTFTAFNGQMFLISVNKHSHCIHHI